MKNGKYIIKFSKQAEKDLKKLKNAKLDKTCKTILSLMEIIPFIYPPSYEKLMGGLDGFYSRRINRHHRIVYQVSKNEIHIIRMWTHYE